MQPQFSHVHVNEPPLEGDVALDLASATQARLPGPIHYTRTPTVEIPDHVLERHRIAATGAAAAAFGGYLRRLELIDLPSRVVVLQGRQMGAPSRLVVDLRRGSDTVEVTGTAAICKVELTRGGKLVFTDYLALYKFEDGWKIVGKSFYRHP